MASIVGKCGGERLDTNLSWTFSQKDCHSIPAGIFITIEDYELCLCRNYRSRLYWQQAHVFYCVFCEFSHEQEAYNCSQSNRHFEFWSSNWLTRNALATGISRNMENPVVYYKVIILLTQFEALANGNVPH